MTSQIALLLGIIGMALAPFALEWISAAGIALGIDPARPAAAAPAGEPASALRPLFAGVPAR